MNGVTLSFKLLLEVRLQNFYIKHSILVNLRNDIALQRGNEIRSRLLSLRYCVFMLLRKGGAEMQSLRCLVLCL